MNASSHRSTVRAAQGGMTMVEVLVTLVLTSVGLLGVAALQLATLKNNQEAYVRSQASILAADILDRIRADSRGFRAGSFDADFNEGGGEGTPAARDVEAWQASIDATLPGGEENAAGRIERNGNIVTITIRWAQRRTESDGDNDELPTFRTRSEI